MKLPINNIIAIILIKSNLISIVSQYQKIYISLYILSFTQLHLRQTQMTLILSKNLAYTN